MLVVPRAAFLFVGRTQRPLWGSAGAKTAGRTKTRMLPPDSDYDSEDECVVRWGGWWRRRRAACARLPPSPLSSSLSRRIAARREAAAYLSDLRARGWAEAAAAAAHRRGDPRAARRGHKTAAPSAADLWPANDTQGRPAPPRERGRVVGAGRTDCSHHALRLRPRHVGAPGRRLGRPAAARGGAGRRAVAAGRGRRSGG